MSELSDFIEYMFSSNIFSCPKCKSDYDKNGCEVVGLKDRDGQSSLYMQYRCKECSTSSGFNMDIMNLDDLANHIIEFYEEKALEKLEEEYLATFKSSQDLENKFEENKKNSSITKEDQNKFSEELKNCATWQDILRKFNISVSDDDTNSKAIV